MITKVNNLNEKSFKNYTGPNVEFKLKNAIFGYNGKGKTSLAEGIKKEFLKDENNTKNNIRFFNKDFIVKNLMLKEGDKLHIKGIQANFGEKEVDIEEKIKKLQEQIVDIKMIENDIEKTKNIINKRIDDIYKQRKGKTAIQKKRDDIVTEKWFANYKKDLDLAINLCGSEEELNSIVSDDSLEKKKRNINLLLIESLFEIEEESITECDKIFKKEYREDVIPKTIIIEWMKAGLEIHKHKDEKCWFCGGYVNQEEIEQRVNLYCDNEKQKAVFKLEQLKRHLIEFGRIVEDILKKQGNIISTLEDNKLIENFNQIKNNNCNIDAFIQLIDKKINNMPKSITYDYNSIIEKISIIKFEYEKIQKRKDEITNLLDTQIFRINDMIKGVIAKEILNDSIIVENRDILIKLNELKLKSINDNSNIEKSMTQLKNQKNNTNDFAMHINKIFRDIGIEFRLDLIDKDYIIKHQNNNITLSLEDISEGEKNLMALMFFYYELFNDEEQKRLKDEIKIIIIDDPISSMDAANKMYVLEIIKKILKMNVQVFIFTHVWEDYCNISYGMKENNDSNERCFEIRKNNGESSVNMIKNRENPYKHAFKEIYELSNKTTADDLSNCEIYHYPNVMRKVLEEFMEFKVQKSLPTLNNINNVCIALGLEYATENEKSKVALLLNVCNILSHKNSRNPEEILKSAKNLMRWIKAVDEIHFNTMKQ